MTHDKARLDISKDEHAYLIEAFKEHIPNTTVWAYGSRVNGTAKPQSDLDMIVFATPKQKLHVFDLREALQESSLPFRVDIFVWDTVPQEFKKSIEETKVVLAEKEGMGNGRACGEELRYGE